MFKKLTDFSYQRNRKEAFGFYLAYLFLALLIGAIFGALLGTSSGATTFQEGFETVTKSSVIPVVAVLYVTVISLLVYVKRKLYHRFRYVILILVTILLVILGGAILGLIIPACMTTRKTVSEDGKS